MPASCGRRVKAWVRCLAWKGERDGKREGDGKAYIMVMVPLGVTSVAAMVLR